MVARDLFLYYLRDVFGRGFNLAEPEATVASDGQHALAFEVRPLVSGEDAAWERRRATLEELIGEGLPARVALWAPAGADLPSDEPAMSEFIAAVRQSVTKLGPHERSYVPLPVTLLMRKTLASGGVVSVTGGLNQYWARFTDRVKGSYDLDSTALHRLPESDEHLRELLDAVVEASQQLEVGDIARIQTIDAWTIQRLSGDGGVTLVGIPPVAATDLGMSVRRNFKRIISEGTPGLRAAEADLRALVVWGPYARVEQEGATVAMRGYDPGSYAGIDFVCLVTDGFVKPLIQPTDARLPWAKAEA